MKKAVMYGAGNIGRGFIGKLFSDSGYSVTFIDINKSVIDALNRDGQYPVGIVKNTGIEDEPVKNVRGVFGADIDTVAGEIAECDIMATALGANVLRAVTRHIAAGIKMRIDSKRPLNIFLCENLLHADKILKELILKELPPEYGEQFDTYIGLVETSIGRMVPALENTDNILRVNVEEYGILPVDKDAFKGGVPDLKNLYPFSPFSIFVERKLYMHNMGHALTAYLGALNGCTYIYQAIADPGILYFVYAALVRSAQGLALSYGIPVKPLLEHATNLIYRFSNRGLKDTVARVGRDTKRKLAPGDRLSGCVSLLKAHGISPCYQLAGIAAALSFSGDGQEEAYAYTESHGAAAAVLQYTGITDECDVREIESFYDILLKGGGLQSAIERCMLTENNRQIV